MAAWEAIAGETPIDPSGLRDKSIGNSLDSVIGRFGYWRSGVPSD